MSKNVNREFNSSLPRIILSEVAAAGMQEVPQDYISRVLSVHHRQERKRDFNLAKIKLERRLVKITSK